MWYNIWKVQILILGLFFGMKYLEKRCRLKIPVSIHTYICITHQRTYLRILTRFICWFIYLFICCLSKVKNSIFMHYQLFPRRKCIFISIIQPTINRYLHLLHLWFITGKREHVYRLSVHDKGEPRVVDVIVSTQIPSTWP